MMNLFENLQNLKENKDDMNKTKIITIKVNDVTGDLENLLKCIKATSDPGHTFDVIVDPIDTKNAESFEMDGDGAFQIIDIKTEYMDKE